MAHLNSASPSTGTRRQMTPPPSYTIAVRRSLNGSRILLRADPEESIPLTQEATEKADNPMEEETFSE
jgi:hypothetical protein